MHGPMAWSAWQCPHLAVILLEIAGLLPDGLREDVQVPDILRAAMQGMIITRVISEIFVLCDRPTAWSVRRWDRSSVCSKSKLSSSPMIA